VTGKRPPRRLAVTVLVLTMVGSFLVEPRAAAASIPEDVAPPTITAAPPAGLNDEVLRWTYHLLDVYRQATGGPTVFSRAAAMMYIAVYDAVNSITPIGEPYLRRPADGPRCTTMPAAQLQQCVNAAINHAAGVTLEQAFPAQATFVRNARNTEDQRIGSGLAVDIGRVIGDQAANNMVNLVANDGATNATAYVPSDEAGAWRPTGNGCTTPVTPNWGSVRPLAVNSGAQFRPPPPGGFSSYPALLASPLYAQHVNEVQALGRFNSTTRTAQQTQIAFFWANDVSGTYLPPGQHFEHTRIVSQQRGLTVQQNARLFGLVALALHDAGITAWGTKFLTPIDLWRPETAIRLAATDNNPATTPDPTWAPLSVLPDGRRFSPCFPAYTSGHATFAGAWSAVMRLFFGTDNISFTATTDDPNAQGVTRQFPSFSAAAQEDARSRIYLGVHYQFDAEFGLSSGTAVGEFVVANRLRPQ
jgi:hypothetical protein